MKLFAGWLLGAVLTVLFFIGADDGIDYTYLDEEWEER